MKRHIKAALVAVWIAAIISFAFWGTFMIGRSSVMRKTAVKEIVTPPGGVGGPFFGECAFVGERMFCATDEPLYSER